MDKQDAFAVILILLGFGLTQLDGGNNSFYVGAGIGTIVIVSVWLVIRMVKAFKKK